MTNESATTAISNLDASDQPDQGPAEVGPAEGASRDASDGSRPAVPAARAAGPDAGEPRKEGANGEDVTARSGDLAGGAGTADGTVTAPTGTGAGVLAVIALAWLGVTLWSARAEVRSPGDGTMAITSAAYALPTVIPASLVGGAAIGLAVGALLARRLGDRPWPRFGATIGAGLLTGLASAALVALGSSGGSAIMALGATIALAATLGGAVTGVRASAVVGATVAAALGVFALSFVIKIFRAELVSFFLFGADETPASRFSAQGWFAATTALGSGLVAGLIAFFYLRRTTRYGREAPRWPAYLVAGAGTGLMLLLTELITRIGGAQVLTVAGSVSEDDQAFQDLTNASRINSGLVVLFLGAITAIIAFGRTLRAPDRES